MEANAPPSGRCAAATRGARVTRRRLLGRLDEALAGGSVVITAGAGCGKTTLLEQAAARSPWPVAWVACSASDRACAGLLMRIADAVSRAAPGSAHGLAERLPAAPGQIDVPATTAELIAVLAGLVEPLVLVVDDAEHLAGATDSLGLLDTLLGAGLPGLRVALASRQELALPFAKPRATGRLVELGPADLAFDAEECAALLRGRSGLAPSPAQVAETMRATEGWALGIALAAAALGRDVVDGDGGGDGLAAVGSAPELRAYLAEELLDSLERLLWGALEHGPLPAPATVEEIAAAFADGTELVSLLEYPGDEVRAEVVAPRRAPPPGGQPLRFELLGRFAVRRGGRRIGEGEWERPVDARLVRFLLVQEGRPASEDAIFDALWPQLAPTGARRSLHVAVSRVRRLFDLPGGGTSLVESENRAYRLALGERDTVDAEEFAAVAAAALGAPGAERRSLLERARSLWGGEPLPEERYADWASAYRERLLDLYTTVLSELVELHEGAGELVAATGAARDLVELDPFNEGGHRALIRAYARAGRRGQALRQYLECRRALVEQLGLEPSEETSRLQARVLAGESL